MFAHLNVPVEAAPEVIPVAEVYTTSEHILEALRQMDASSHRAAINGRGSNPYDPGTIARENKVTHGIQESLAAVGFSGRWTAQGFVAVPLAHKALIGPDYSETIEHLVEHVTPEQLKYLAILVDQDTTGNQDDLLYQALMEAYNIFSLEVEEEE